MNERITPFLHIPGTLGTEDLDFLRNACKQHLEREQIPCYVLLDHLKSTTFVKIKERIERALGEQLYYLNDFYLYTDDRFRTGWHMDTELFTFHRAVNAWILLSPHTVDDPVGFIRDVNESAETFHHVRIDGDQCLFGDYDSGNTRTMSLAAIEAGHIHTPRITQGDILILNPRRFHRTNVRAAKHAIAIKFVMKSSNGFLAENQVNGYLWPEVDRFNELVKNASSWEGVIDGIRRLLATESGRNALSDGFYPEKFALYRQMVAHL